MDSLIIAVILTYLIFGPISNIYFLFTVPFNGDKGLVGLCVFLNIVLNVVAFAIGVAMTVSVLLD